MLISAGLDHSTAPVRPHTQGLPQRLVRRPAALDPWGPLLDPCWTPAGPLLDPCWTPKWTPGEPKVDPW